MKLGRFFFGVVSTDNQAAVPLPLADDNYVPPEASEVTKEIRLGVVMYGGISLCVYMNGITEQLYRLVRASARDPKNEKEWRIKMPETPVSTKPGDELPQPSIERVFRRVLSEISAPTHASDMSAPKLAPVTSRVVVDVISGTSAGGLNGVFLAKALANNQTIDSLASLWVKEGDMALLMNDERPWDIKNRVPAERPPESLLNSRRIADRLFRALDGMARPTYDPSDEPLQPRTDLFVTATDLKGYDASLGVSTNRSISEVRHRSFFHFAYDKDDLGTLNPAGSNCRNDFVRASIPFLTFVCRATSCILPAFEPVCLADMTVLPYPSDFSSEPVGGQPSTDVRYLRDEDGIRFAGFFRDYWSNARTVEERQATTSAAGANTRKSDDQISAYEREQILAFQHRFFGDGGYGDNYPFSYAIDTIDSRTADVEVDRKLLYVEPDPSLDIYEDDASEKPKTGRFRRKGADRPNVVQHLQAAAGVKTTETIRDDIRRLHDRNHLLDRLSSVKHAAKHSTAAKAPTPALEEKASGYDRLRAASATDELSKLLALGLGFEMDSPYFDAIRYLVKAIRKVYYDQEDVPGMGFADFLNAFDLDSLRREAAYLARTGTAVAKADLIAVRTMLGQLPRIFRLAPTEGRKAKHLESDEARRANLIKQLPNDRIFSVLTSIRDGLDAVNVTPSVLADIILKASDNQGRQGLADGILDTLQGEHPDKVDAVAIGLLVAFGDITAYAKRELLKARGIAELPDSVSNYEPDPAFLGEDQMLFPVKYGIGSTESDYIDTLRVSPLDCNTLVPDQREAKTKLAGTGLGHFSGFFLDVWRVEDILWGRLDGAERLICSLMGDSQDVPNFVLLAQLAIIGEFTLHHDLKDTGPNPDEQVAKQQQIEELLVDLLGISLGAYIKTGQGVDSLIERQRVLDSVLSQADELTPQARQALTRMRNS